MPELAITDLSTETLARFGSNNAAQAALDAALAAARRYCGWHVSPVIEDDERTLDGPGTRALELPTRRLLALNEVAELGEDLDPTTLDWSETGLVRKQSSRVWSSRYRSIVVSIDHGYTEAEAADWRQAIITMVDGMAPGDGSEAVGPLVRKRVDDVEYQWSSSDLSTRAGLAIYSVVRTLDAYRLPEVLFV